MTHETVTTTLADIIAIARRHRLSPNGCLPNCWEPDGHPARGRDWGATHVDQVDLCRAYLRSPDRPSYRRARSSYFLKHEVERWRHAAGNTAYVCNGAFLVACFIEGIKPRREHVTPPSPNAMIVLRKRVAS